MYLQCSFGVARAARFGNLFYFLRLCLHYEYVIHSPLNFNFSSLSLRVDGCGFGARLGGTDCNVFRVSSP